MNVPGGLAASAAATVVRLMVVELPGVDTGYIGRFAELAANGGSREAAARLEIDARCLEAAVTAGLSQVTNVRATEPAGDLEPLRSGEVEHAWRHRIEGMLAAGRLPAAGLNGFCAEFAAAAEDGDRLLRVITELDRYRRLLWRDVRRPSMLSDRDRERLRELDYERLDRYAQIRARYPVAVRPDRVQAALVRQYEQRRQELAAGPAGAADPAERQGYAAAIEQHDSAHELALRRQSVPGYAAPIVPPPVPMPSDPLAARASAVTVTVLKQLGQQREQLVRLRDAESTELGRAGYEQAIAQLDVGMEQARRQAEATAAITTDASITGEQHRAAEAAMALVSDAITVAGGRVDAVLRTAGAQNAHLMEQSRRLAGLTADLNLTARERSQAQATVRNAEVAGENARRAGLVVDQRAAQRHLEHARRRYADADARYAEIQARIRDEQRILRDGPKRYRGRDRSLTDPAASGQGEVALAEPEPSLYSHIDD